MAEISDALRVELSQTFALGFLDAKAEDMIAANYIENPSLVHAEVYQVGRLAYSEVERRAIQRN